MPKGKRNVHIIDNEEVFNSGTKSKKIKTQQQMVTDYIEDNSTFGKFIKNSGYILRKGDQPHILNCDQANFKSKLKKEFNSARNYGGVDEKCTEFIQGLEEHLKDELNLKWGLLYTQTNPNCETARKGQQDSLIRLLLNLDIIQPEVIALLTEIFFVVAYSDETSNDSVDIPRLILTNLRWLDHIVVPEVLTEKITELLQGSVQNLQQEIISFVPNILNDDCHSKIADVFIELFNTTPELIPSILDSFPYLSLSPEDSDDIQHRVLKTLSGIKPQNAPTVLKFLLHNTTPATAPETLNEIREKIDLPGEVSGNFSSPTISQKRNDICKERQDLDVLLFSNIKWAFLSCRFLPVAWLKVIDDVDGSEVRPVDFLVLVLLYEIFPTRRKSIESIIRNKIRRGLKSDDLLQNTFCHHSSVLKYYFDSVKKIGCSFLRSTEPSFTQFGCFVYKYCFLYLDSYEQEVVLAVLSHLGDNESVRNAALSLLSHLSHNCIVKMSKHTILLKGSLDITDLLSLREAKKLMDSIIHLAHADKNQAALQDELAILVNKQLSHPDLKYKRLGVLSAVITIKTMFGLQNDDDTDIEDVVDPPSKSMQEAEILFEMVHSATSNSPPAAALFMDELASNILRSGLNNMLEKWISHKIINDFEQFYVTEVTAELSEDDELLPLPVECQWNLEEADDSSEDKSIALKLAVLAVKDSSKNSKGASIVMLAPHFRLMRMVESHLNGGDLGSIDALLGCPILAPKSSVYEKLSLLSVKEKYYALDCVFYAVNWFREIINAFATQKDKDLKLKVYQRLRQVIELQKLLSRILPGVPSYVPPPAVFDCDFSHSVPSISAGTSSKLQKKTGTKRTASGKKKTTNKDGNVNLTLQNLKSQMEAEGTQKESKDTQDSNVTACLSGYRAYLRELHLDVFNLLYRKLSFDDELENNGLLTISEAEFLLTDLNTKLTRSFESGTKKASVLGKTSVEKDIGFAHLDLFTPKEVAGQGYRFLKPICVHLQSIASFFEILNEENDGLIDGPGVFTPKCASITTVATMLFSTVNLFLTAANLQKEDSIINDILKILAKNLEENAVTQMSTEDLLSSSFRYMSKFKDTIMNISTANALSRVLQALATLSPDSREYEKKLVEIIELFLRKEWYATNGSLEKGATFNRQIAELLNIMFTHTSSVKLIYTFCINGLQKMAQSEDIELTTLNKGTLPVYYKCLMENLIKGTKKQLAKRNSSEKKLEIWHIAIKSFAILVGILKKFESNLMLTHCLKYSKGFLELFLSLGMPLLDKCLHTDQQDVIALIKNLQSSTRFLQHVCTHSKVKQDVRLMQFVPLVKRALEAIIYRVKAMLVVNKCSDAFWLGNLKNRDLQGEEILTQNVGNEDENNDEHSEESDVNLEEDEKNAVSDDNSTEYSKSF